MHVCMASKPLEQCTMKISVWELAAESKDIFPKRIEGKSIPATDYVDHTCSKDTLVRPSSGPVGL